MVGTNNAVAAPRNPTQGETAIQEFANSSLSPEQLSERAAPLLNSRELLQDVQRLTPEVRTKFVDKVDQVCRHGRSFSLGIFPSLISAKAYPTVGPQNAKFITVLGNVCSATVQLPTSAILSEGLEKLGERRGVWRTRGHLAKGNTVAGRWLSKPFVCQTLGKGERGAYTVSAGGPLSNKIYRFCGNGCPCGGDLHHENILRFHGVARYTISTRPRL
jgi:hypothetical protein